VGWLENHWTVKVYLHARPSAAISSWRDLPRIALVHTAMRIYVWLVRNRPRHARAPQSPTHLVRIIHVHVVSSEHTNNMQVQVVPRGHLGGDTQLALMRCARDLVPQPVDLGWRREHEPLPAQNVESSSYVVEVCDGWRAVGTYVSPGLIKVAQLGKRGGLGLGLGLGVCCGVQQTSGAGVVDADPRYMGTAKWWMGAMWRGIVRGLNGGWGRNGSRK
jgi:hypothetical protein